MPIKFLLLLSAATLALSACTKNVPTQNRTSPSQSQSQTTTQSSMPVDLKASFAIFTNGTLRIFTDSKYHNRSEDVFIEKSASNTVRVKKTNVTWGDFFKSLPAPFNLTSDCLTTGTGQKFCSGDDGTLKFYLNGELKDNLLDQQIRNDDKVLVSFGQESEEEIKKQLEQIPPIS